MPILSHTDDWVAVISVSVALCQTPDHGCRAIASCGMPIYAPAFAGIRAYCHEGMASLC